MARRLLAAGLVAVAVGLVVGAVTVARDRGDSFAPERSMSISTSLNPRTHVFAEPVVADVALEFDSRNVDPERVRVEAPFRPYEQLGSPTRTRTDVGDFVRIRYRYELACFSKTCLPEDVFREVRLPSLRVTYTLREVRSRVTESAQWPTVRVSSRLNAVEVPRSRWRAALDFPAVSYRLGAGWLAALLIAGSLACLAVAGALGLALAPREAPTDAVELPDRAEQTALERALDAVAGDNGSPADRRRALERLARELRDAGRPGFADRARELAWSPRAPSSESIEVLAADVRETL